mgnify:CR=1 FL=1
MLNEFINTFSSELTNVMESITSVSGGMMPDFAGNIFGDFITALAPVWNPFWNALSEILNVLFGF